MRCLLTLCLFLVCSSAQAITYKWPTAPVAVAELPDSYLMVFQAKWCGPCMTVVKPALNQLANNKWVVLDPSQVRPDNAKTVHILTVDVDRYPDIAAKYNLTSLPTIIHIKGKKEIKRYMKAMNHQAVSNAYHAYEPTAYPSRQGAGQWYGPFNNRRQLINHLYTDSNHSGRYDKDWLEGLTYNQLLTLHDDDHNGHATATIKMQASSLCPNGQCPTTRRQRRNR